MFTGIVEELGHIKRIERGANSIILSVSGDVIFSDLKLGDSVATNGVCLTVTSILGKVFTADVMPETLHRSSLGSLSVGSHVNLERAMPADGRFGGHIVTGHIDGMGKIVKMTKDDNAIWLEIAADSAILRYVIEKGSITIDGISLTVASVSENGFAVSIIPHTASITTLGKRKVGDSVNLEVDIIGKYVEKLLHGSVEKKAQSNITASFLAEHGFGG